MNRVQECGFHEGGIKNEIVHKFECTHPIAHMMLIIIISIYKLSRVFLVNL